MEREIPVECSSCNETVWLERRPYDSGLVVTCGCVNEINVSECVGQNKLFEPHSGKWADMEIDGTANEQQGS